jgi:hypothetical protein
MKLRDLGNLNEGFFSDLTGGFGRDDDDYETRELKRQQKIIARAKKPFLKDFIADFFADYKANEKAGTFNKPAPSSQGLADRDKFDRLKPTIQKMVARGTINNTTELGAYLAKNAGTLWKNTPNKPEVLKNLLSEAKYNFLLESIIAEQTDGTVANWVSRWFAAYMQGSADYSEYEQTIQQLAKQFQDAGSDGEKEKAITQLANIGFEVLLKEPKNIPIGAMNVSDLNIDAQRVFNNSNERSRVQKMMNDMAQQNPTQFKKMVQDAQDGANKP